MNHYAAFVAVDFLRRFERFQVSISSKFRTVVSFCAKRKTNVSTSVSTDSKVTVYFSIVATGIKRYSNGFCPHLVLSFMVRTEITKNKFN